MDVPDRGQEDLKPAQTAGQRLARGASWVVAGEVIAQAVAIITNVMVARALGPEPYGMFAIAGLLLGFATLFRDLGFSPAIVTGRLSAPEELDSAHWLLVASGAALALASAAAAPLVAFIFNSPGVAGVIRVTSLSLFAFSWGIVPMARLQRRGQFNRLAVLSVCQNLLAMVVAISLARAGYGVWALVVPNILASALAALGAWCQLGCWPNLRFSWSVLGGHVREGANVTGFSMFNYLTRNADNAIIGRQFGEEALGQYSFAYTLMKRPVSIVSKALGSPLLPMLADLRDDLARCDRAFVRIVGAVLRVAAPPLLMGALLSHVLVPVLFGERWLGSVPLVRIFLLLGALQVIGPLFGTLWLSLGQTSLLLRWGLVSGLGSIPVFWVGASVAGAEGLATAYALYSAAMLVPTIALTRRLCGLGLEGMSTFLVAAAVDLGAMAAMVLIGDFWLARAEAPAWVRLLAGSLLGTATYVSLLRCFRRAELRTLLNAIPAALRTPLQRLLGLPL